MASILIFSFPKKFVRLLLMRDIYVKCDDFRDAENVIWINLTHRMVMTGRKLPYSCSFVVIVTCYNKNIFYFICNSHFYSIEHNKLYASNGSLGNIVAAKVHYGSNKCESRFRTTLWF